MTNTISKRRMILIASFVVLFAAAIVVAMILFSQVDDWSRDLTTNHASTSASAPTEDLRPITTDRSPQVVAEYLKQTAAGLRGWKLDKETTTDAALELHFVRTTRWLGFKDDITVRIAPDGQGGCVVHAESRSRMGKGDLGQNPRNLRELLSTVRRRIEGTSAF